MHDIFLTIFRPKDYMNKTLCGKAAVIKTYALTLLLSAFLSAIYIMNGNVKISAIMIYSPIIFLIAIIGIHIEITIIYALLKVFKVQNVTYFNLTKNMLLTVYWVYNMYVFILSPLKLLDVQVIMSLMLLFLRSWKYYLIYFLIQKLYCMDTKKRMSIVGILIIIDVVLHFLTIIR